MTTPREMMPSDSDVHCSGLPPPRPASPPSADDAKRLATQQPVRNPPQQVQQRNGNGSSSGAAGGQYAELQILCERLGTLQSAVCRILGPSSSHMPLEEALAALVERAAEDKQSREEAEEQLRELRKQVAPLADMLEAATKLAQASETGREQAEAQLKALQGQVKSLQIQCAALQQELADTRERRLQRGEVPPEPPAAMSTPAVSALPAEKKIAPGVSQPAVSAESEMVQDLQQRLAAALQRADAAEAAQAAAAEAADKGRTEPVDARVRELQAELTHAHQCSLADDAAAQLAASQQKEAAAKDQLQKAHEQVLELARAGQSWLTSTSAGLDKIQGQLRLQHAKLQAHGLAPRLVSAQVRLPLMPSKIATEPAAP